MNFEFCLPTVDPLTSPIKVAPSSCSSKRLTSVTSRRFVRLFRNERLTLGLGLMEELGRCRLELDELVRVKDFWTNLLNGSS